MASVRTWTAMVTVCALGVATASAEMIEFNFGLDGGQEVPAVDTPAVGAAKLIYNTDTQHFNLDMMIFGIELDQLLDVGPNLTPVHAHYGAPGENGAIAVDLGFFESFVEDGLGIRLQIQIQDALFGGPQGNLTTDPAVNEAALFAGELYVNIHTDAFPGGEIRGQIVPEPATVGLLLLATALVSRRRRIAR